MLLLDSCLSACWTVDAGCGSGFRKRDSEAKLSFHRVLICRKGSPLNQVSSRFEIFQIDLKFPATFGDVDVVFVNVLAILIVDDNCAEARFEFFAEPKLHGLRSLREFCISLRL